MITLILLLVIAPQNFAFLKGNQRELKQQTVCRLNNCSVVDYEELLAQFRLEYGNDTISTTTISSVTKRPSSIIPINANYNDIDNDSNDTTANDSRRRLLDDRELYNNEDSIDNNSNYKQYFDGVEDSFDSQGSFESEAVNGQQKKIASQSHDDEFSSIYSPPGYDNRVIFVNNDNNSKNSYNDYESNHSYQKNQKYDVHSQYRFDDGHNSQNSQRTSYQDDEDGYYSFDDGYDSYDSPQNTYGDDDDDYYIFDDGYDSQDSYFIDYENDDIISFPYTQDGYEVQEQSPGFFIYDYEYEDQDDIESDNEEGQSSIFTSQKDDSDIQDNYNSQSQSHQQNDEKSIFDYQDDKQVIKGSIFYDNAKRHQSLNNDQIQSSIFDIGDSNDKQIDGHIEDSLFDIQDENQHDYQSTCFLTPEVLQEVLPCCDEYIVKELEEVDACVLAADFGYDCEEFIAFNSLKSQTLKRGDIVQIC
eukprot:TRINITY_DN1454_c0_g1_i1.p1 TRINITY_DN1454_c0_g1~~TRINITY_DN1454_c0_g1_i1.p1  ORF type:complete len:473 (-),score=51.61 TRINITY_DN1454_c0_g1_i1:287-1705(-)